MCVVETRMRVAELEGCCWASKGLELHRAWLVKLERRGLVEPKNDS